MNVPDEVCDEPQSNTLLMRGASGKLSTVKVPRNSFNDAVTQLVISLLIVCVRFLWEVDKVAQVHFGNLTASLVRPCRCVG